MIDNRKDIIIIIILSYLLIYIIINIYNSITKDDSNIVKNENDNSSNNINEEFSTNYIGRSLKFFNSSVYLSFPGTYLETAYRLATITQQIKDLVNYLIDPLLLTINKKEGYYFKQGDIISLITREYKNGTIYYLEVFIIDSYTPISRVLKLEGVINNYQQYYLNYVSVLNKEPKLSYLERINLLSIKNKSIKQLKNTILPY